MKRLTAADILDADRYEAVREVYRRRVIAHKEARRVGVGDRVTLVFEDRETIRYQIQEMTRIERIHEASKIQHEIDTYNELIPGDGELSATLFIEIPDLDRIRPELDRLVGIDEHVSFVLGEGDGEQAIQAQFAPEQMEEDRISAVQYVLFPFAPAQIEALGGSARLRLRIDHPHYRAEAEILRETRESLRRDLVGSPPVLLDPSAVEEPRDVVLFEDARVRVVRPARPLSPEHLVVEPQQAVPSLAEADPELMAAMLEQVQRFAGEIASRLGPCRVWTDVDPKADEPLRWHLVARR